MEQTKVCAKCGRNLEVNDVNFHKSKREKDGFMHTCKKCRSEYEKMRYQKNKERITEYVRERTRLHKGVINANLKLYREKNKEHITEIRRLYRQKNKEFISKSRKLNYQKNPQKILAHFHTRKAIKKQLPANLTVEQWQKVKQHFKNKCCYCGEEKPLEQEHFVALSRQGEFTINNIIPACRSCNSSKRDKDFFEWYPTYVHYNKKREQKILNYLNYKNNIQQLTLAL